MTYEVWIFGYDKDYNRTDYEQLIKTFTNKKESVDFAKNYSCEHELPCGVEHCEVVVEEVEKGKYHDTIY